MIYRYSEFDGNNIKSGVLWREESLQKIIWIIIVGDDKKKIAIFEKDRDIYNQYYLFYTFILVLPSFSLFILHRYKASKASRQKIDVFALIVSGCEHPTKDGITQSLFISWSVERLGLSAYLAIIIIGERNWPTLSHYPTAMYQRGVILSLFSINTSSFCPPDMGPPLTFH